MEDLECFSDAPEDFTHHDNFERSGWNGARCAYLQIASYVLWSSNGQYSDHSMPSTFNSRPIAVRGRTKADSYPLLGTRVSDFDQLPQGSFASPGVGAEVRRRPPTNRPGHSTRHRTTPSSRRSQANFEEPANSNLFQEHDRERYRNTSAKKVHVLATNLRRWMSGNT